MYAVEISTIGMCHTRDRTKIHVLSPAEQQAWNRGQKLGFEQIMYSVLTPVIDVNSGLFSEPAKKPANKVHRLAASRLAVVCAPTRKQ